MPNGGAKGFLQGSPAETIFRCMAIGLDKTRRLVGRLSALALGDPKPTVCYTGRYGPFQGDSVPK